MDSFRLLVPGVPASAFPQALNFHAGDDNVRKRGIVSKRLDLLSEFDAVYKKEYGLRISAAAWYDAALAGILPSQIRKPRSIAASGPGDEGIPLELPSSDHPLFARDLITKFQHPDHVEYHLTDAAYAAVGRKRKVPAPVTPDAETEAAVSAAEAKWAQEKQGVAKPRTRENSKQAAVIQMLQRPDGTTIQQVMESTGWQAHTVRGTFAGALKKKLGLNIVSAKDATGERVYRIA